MGTMTVFDCDILHLSNPIATAQSYVLEFKFVMALDAKLYVFMSVNMPS
jgi:hypothetical protein